MNDRQFEETADAAPAAAPAVGHEETAAVAAVELAGGMRVTVPDGAVGANVYGLPGEQPTYVPVDLAAADGELRETLPDIAWNEVELAECEAMYWHKPAGEREDVLTLIRALRKARTRLADALDAYQSGRDAMQAECERLRTRVADLEAAAQLTAEMTMAGARRLAEAERECERLEAECQDLADKGDVANLQHAQLWARCERAEREREEARAAGGENIAENAALRADREWWRNAARQLAGNVMRMVGAFDAAVAENARGGPLSG